MSVQREGRSDTKRRPLALQVSVPTEDLSYPVLVGPGLLQRVGTELRRGHGSARRVAVVSDSNVMPLYADRLQETLEAQGFEVSRIQIPAGEASKNPGQLVQVVEEMVAAGLSRRDLVVALGGGVTGDITGLAAATFMRGIPFLQCPTSLLAQVDASVGGKVAVDLPSGKNLFGVFHFPTAVMIDPEALQTLPKEEFACGLAEMLKHGALFSAEHFEELVSSADKLYAQDADLLTRLIATSVALKANCVSRDPHELAGRGRELLNLGHTVGHALELVSDFELRHGEAVALGLIAAARISEAKEVAEAGLEAKMRTALEALRLPTDLDAWLERSSLKAVESAMGRDKKRSSTHITYIALARIGEPTVLSLTAPEIVALLRVT